MSHPIDGIIRAVDSSTQPSDSREKLLIYDVDKGTFLSKKPSFFSWNRDIQYYIIAPNKKVKGDKIVCTWADNLRDIYINININYELKCPSNVEELLVNSLQEGDNLGEAFERLISDLVEEFYEDCVNDSVDAILMYYRKVNGGLSIFQRLQQFLQTQIKEQTSLNVKLVLFLDNERELKPLEIIAKEPIEIRLKYYQEKIALEYEFVLNILESEKIHAILEFHRNHEIEEIIVALMKKHLLANVSLHHFCYHLEELEKELWDMVNEIILPYGREVGALILKPKGIESLIPARIPLFEEKILCRVEGFPSDIKVDNKIALSVSDLGRLKLKKIENPKKWIVEELKDIIQKEVISFENYTKILLDLALNKDASKYEALIKEKITTKAISIGYHLTYEAKIRTDFELPKESEPIHHVIPCRIEDYKKPIILVHKVGFHIEDTEKYIRSNIGNLSAWIKGNLEVIVKNILSFKTFAEVAIESAKNPYTENTYKTAITEKIEEKAVSIGCTVQQLLIAPRLKPLEWLEDFTIEFEEEFPTQEDGIPIKLGITIEGHVKDLEKLPNKYLKPNGDIAIPIQGELIKTIGGIFKKTSSERAYLEFYAEKEGVQSVSQEIRNAIVENLKSLFDISKPNIILRTLDTPIVLRYKELRKSQGKFQIELMPSVGKNVQKVVFNGTYGIVGISNWNTFKAKDFNTLETLQKISHHLKNVLEKRLRRANVNALLSNDMNEVFNLEEGVKIFSQEQITRHYGLLIEINYFDRENTEQEIQEIHTISETIRKKGVIDRENIEHLLIERYKKIPELVKEKEILLGKKKVKLISKKEKKRLKEIKKILDDYSEKTSVIAEKDTETNSPKLLESNTVNNIFNMNTTNSKELNEHKEDE